MAEPPSLSKYFNGENADDVTDSQFQLKANSLSEQVQKITLSNEPDVCRIFAKASVPPEDPAAAFFDSLGSTPRHMDFSTTQNQQDTNFIGVSSLETDRRRDAWIPSERTRKCLIASATAPSGTYFPERDTLTMPGILLEEELGDLIGETVALSLGEAEASQRRILSTADVTQDERGLRELIQAGAYRSAINLTAILLNIYGQGRGRAGHPSKHSPRSLQLWFTRIALLMKTKMYDIAETEATQFGELDKPDLFYQFYPEMYPGKSGSIVSFSFRLLLAELPMHCGKSKEAMTKLFNVLAVIRQMIFNLHNSLCEDGSTIEISASDRAESVKLWKARETRVLHSIINCAISQKDFVLAIELLQQLCDKEGIPQDILLSALGRLHLHLGDVQTAESYFKQARGHSETATSFRDIVDKGLVAVAQNSFTEAYKYFEQASAMQPSNVMVLNNMGVCLLYGGQLKQAVSTLESAITTNPSQSLHEPLLLNLCTLYDMESSKGRMKKFALLKQIAQYQADAPATILEKLYG